MIKGYTLPRTPLGKSSLVPAPPWYFAGNVLAIEYETDQEKAAAFLPEGLSLESNRCAVYFVEWQYASESGEEYLDPVCSQYRETIILLSAAHQGKPVAYCPFIWVDQDKSLMRGLIQGWPKQLGETWITRAHELPSKATPTLGQGGRFGAALSVQGRRLVEGQVTLRQQTDVLPSPSFAKAVNVRYFPELVREKQGQGAVHELVQLLSRDVQVSPIWQGEADLTFYEHPYTELPDLKPTAVLAGYRFSVALTVDNLLPLKDLG